MSSSELKLGCLNVQAFRTAQVYFSQLIDSFDIFAISDCCLFAEQLEILKTSIIIHTIALQSVLKIIRLSYQASLRMAELHHFGKRALMIWLNLQKILIQIASLEFVVVLMKESSFCMCICSLLSHCIEKFNKYLDNLWALYDSLSTEGFVIIMGDLNGDLGSSLGDKGCYAPNDRGLRLLDFANYFNL